MTQKSPSGHHPTTLSGWIFATEAYIDNRRKLVKQQYILQMSSQYGELRPTNGWGRLVRFRHPSEFQWVSCLLASLLQRCRSPQANQTLHDVWLSPRFVHYIYIFSGSCPRAEFCNVQNSLCIQVLCSHILASSLHGTPAVDGSQTLRRGTGNGIRELL